MAHKGALVWLDGDPTAKPKTRSEKSVIRSRAATWSHRSGSRKQYTRTTGRSWTQIVVRGKQPSSAASCLPCQKKAVKCDGRFPCQNCDTTGDVSQCAFEPDSGARWSLISVDKPMVRHLNPNNDGRPGQFFGEFAARMQALAGAETNKLIIMLAHETTVGDRLLQESLDTVVLGIGTLDNDSGLAKQARSDIAVRRSRVLGMLQEELRKPDAVYSRSVLFTIYLLSWFELLVCENSVAWAMHLNGLVRLMQLRGPYKFTQGIEAAAFRRMRLLTITLDIMARRRCFLSSPEWCHVPWSGERINKTLAEKVTDTLVEVPGIIASLDDQIRGDITKQELDSIVVKWAEDMKISKIQHLDRSHACYYRFQHSPTAPDLETIGDAIVMHEIVDEEFAFAFALYLTGWLMALRFGPDYRFILPLSPRRLVELIVSTFEAVCRRNRDQIVGSTPWTFPLRVAYMTPLGDEGLLERIRKLAARRLSALGSMPQFGQKLSLTAAQS